MYEAEPSCINQNMYGTVPAHIDPNIMYRAGPSSRNRDMYGIFPVSDHIVPDTRYKAGKAITI